MTDWPVKTLGEFFDSKPKNSESLKQKDYLSSGKFPVVDQGQELIGGFTNDQHLVRDFETPVIVFGDHTRCVKYIDFPFASGADGTKILVPRKGVDPRYAYFQLLSIELPTKGYARHFGELSKYSFVLPPLEEQKRIVALLDAATARVTELTACYEQARTHANNLFTSALRDALESNPDWPVKTLGEICELQRGHDLPTPERREGEVPILGSTGVTGFHNVARYEGPGVAIGRSGFIGGAQYCDVSYWPLNTCLFVKNFFGNEPRWVYYVLKNIDFSQYNSGTTQPSLNRNNLSHIPVSTPSLGAQQEIVAQLELTVAKTSEMVAAYDAKLTAAKNLRQSILESAFAGDL